MSENRLEWVLKRELVLSMIDQIHSLGEDETWRIINETFDMTNKLTYIELYLSALQILKRQEGGLYD